jgi:prolyl oligopeptidase
MCDDWTVALLVGFAQFKLNARQFDKLTNSEIAAILGVMRLMLCGLSAVAAGVLFSADANGHDYPKPTKSDQVDDYHGTKVPDPYRGLENPDSPESRAWIEAENKLTFDYLAQIPERPLIKKRLTELWNYERYGVPFKMGNHYFLTRNDGLQNQSVLYALDDLTSEPKLLLDPNKLSTDGTVALKGSAISEDGNYLAYGLSKAGSDWEEWKIRKVSTAEDEVDLLKWVKFSGASWTREGNGIFYSRFDEPKEATALQSVNYFQKLYYHRLGTKQSDDALVYERKDHKDWQFSGDVTDDGHYLVISISQGTDPKRRVYYKDLEKAGSLVVPLLDEFDAAYDIVGSNGSEFYFHTDLDAPRGRVIAIDLNRPVKSDWREIVPQSADTLKSVSLLDNQFVCSYMKDARSAIQIFSMEGKHIIDVDLPGYGTAGGFGGRQKNTETFYAFTTFTAPATIYRYDLVKHESSVFKAPKLKFSPNDYETTQVFYKSKDGTRVPMFITRNKRLSLDGTAPTLLYGYGGFNISLTPSFSPSTLVWLEMGGIFAQPNLRGGGEYGESWHQAGTKLHKQNVFDDFISAAEWLISNKYTSREKLAISGGSNGGLLVGACMTQRPDLFGAALPAVGVMDMLRFHKFTIGWAWTSDYGSADDADQFKALLKYSPLHNIKPGTVYPPTLITTADHDDRVVPAHSFKFAATLQAAQAGPAPILIRIETKAGHGAGKPTSKIIDEAADKWAFLVKALNVSVPSRN